MVISRCCRDKVYVYSANEGASFYMCYKCDQDCETMFHEEHEEGSQDDAGRESQTETVACPA